MYSPYSDGVFGMGVITLKLDDTIERRLRARAAHLYGLARGSLSRAVEDALTQWLSSDSPPALEENPSRYFAVRAGKTLIEAASLKQLARRLKKAGINPRDVEIRSKPQPPSAEKLGLRVGHRLG